ncbi:hypothetical protein Tco_0213542 [Tanacetum coccineum]
MAEQNDYITATRKNFISNDNEGRMVEKCIVEIQGTFLVKIHNDTFYGNDGENAYEHIISTCRSCIMNGLERVIGSITKKKKNTWDDMLEKFILKFHHLSNHNEEETEKDENPNEIDNVPEIFRIEGNLFDFETPLCEAYHEFNCLLNIDTDLFTHDIKNLKTYDEYEREMNNNKARGAEEPWWYDELADGKLKDETLALKAKIEGS